MLFCPESFSLRENEDVFSGKAKGIFKNTKQSKNLPKNLYSLRKYMNYLKVPYKVEKSSIFWSENGDILIILHEVFGQFWK